MKLIITLLGLTIILNSCKTYTVSPESLKSQFTSDVNKLEDVKVNNPFSTYLSSNEKANKIKTISVTDKNGEAFNLDNSPAIEMRITLQSGKRKIFYFDTVTIENDTLKGLTSRIIGLKDKVAYNEIIKIELQDGGKNYHYIMPTKDEIILKNSEKTFELRGEVQRNLNFKIDTISVNCDIYKNILYAKCKFEKNNSELAILYHLTNNNKIELISTREISPYQDKVWWINQLYIDMEKIFLTKQFCVAKDGNSKVGKYKEYKFNKELNTEFLGNISFEIFDEINKNYR